MLESLWSWSHSFIIIIFFEKVVSAMKNSVLCVVFYLFVISTDVTVTGKYAAATNDALNFWPRTILKWIRLPIKSIRLLIERILRSLIILVDWIGRVDPKKVILMWEIPNALYKSIVVSSLSGPFNLTRICFYIRSSVVYPVHSPSRVFRMFGDFLLIHNVCVCVLCTFTK